VKTRLTIVDSWGFPLPVWTWVCFGSNYVKGTKGRIYTLEPPTTALLERADYRRIDVGEELSLNQLGARKYGELSVISLNY